VTDTPYLSGSLLLAMPGMGDPRFDRAAIAMCVHDPNGALGIVVNKPLPMTTVAELMKQLEIDPGIVSDATPVFLGGPVEPQRGFVLHSLDYDAGGTLNVDGKWGLTATLDILRDIAGGKGPDKWLVALGYTGWGEGQLDEELTRHGWLAVPGDAGLVFDSAPDRRWPRAYASAGIDPAKLSTVSGRA
jgi:putative transcriptional regulator